MTEQVYFNAVRLRYFNTTDWLVNVSGKKTALYWEASYNAFGDGYLGKTNRETAEKWLNENVRQYRLSIDSVSFEDEQDAILFYLRFS